MSGITQEIKSRLINYLLSKGIDTINASDEVRLKIKESMNGEDRTILLKIKDFETMGFGVEDDRLVKMSDIKNPTVTVVLSEDTFIQIVRGKLTFKEGFFYGDMDVIGEDWIRDYLTFNTIFEQFSYIAKEMGL